MDFRRFSTVKKRLFAYIATHDKENYWFQNTHYSRVYIRIFYKTIKEKINLFREHHFIWNRKQATQARLIEKARSKNLSFNNYD